MSDYSSEVEVTQHLALRPPPLSLGVNVEKPKFPQYAVYVKRLESFLTWPEYLHIDKNDFVEAGLVYTGVGDSVRCYFCGGGLRNWEYGDVPMEEHAKWYPNCPHILLVKGQWFADKVSRGEKTDVYDATNKQQDTVDKVDYIESEAAQSCIEIGYSEQMVQKAINILIQRHGKRNFKGKDICEILFEIETNSEDFDDVCVLSEETKHKSCEKDTKPATEETSGGLRNWELGDVPMEEHAKWYPNCPHILLVKGQWFADKVSRGEKTDVYDATNKQQDTVDKVDYIESEAAQSCIEIGYSEQMVQKAINILIQRHGKRNFKGKDICEILFEIETNSEDFDDVCVLSEETKHKSCEKDTKPATEETKSLERLLEENHKLKANQMCKICLHIRADVIFLPCGHMICCPQCAPALIKCPICRKNINGQIKAFFSLQNKV